MAAVAFTAQPGYQAAGRDLHGRICRESYHAVLTGGPARVIRVGFITRHRGEALCGAAPLDDCPPGLFAPMITCAACQAIAAREHIEITGGQL